MSIATPASMQDIFNLCSAFENHKQFASVPLDTLIDTLSFLELGNLTIGRNTLKQLRKPKPKPTSDKFFVNEPSYSSPRDLWTAEDDELLKKLAKSYRQDWKKISRRIFRVRKLRKTPAFLKRRHQIILGQIKETKLIPYSTDEDSLILEGISKYGFDWDKISDLVSTRDAVSVKNRYYFQIRKTLAPI